MSKTMFQLSFNLIYVSGFFVEKIEIISSEIIWNVENSPKISIEADLGHYRLTLHAISVGWKDLFLLQNIFD